MNLPRVSLLSSPSLSLVALVLSLCGVRGAEDAGAASPEADRAWEAVQKVSELPQPPAEWRTNRPSQDAVRAFRQTQLRLAGEGADKAREFRTKYPNHGKAKEALRKEMELARTAVRYGNTNRIERLEALRTELLQDPTLGEDDRFQLRLESVQMEAMTRQGEGMPAVMAALEKGVRQLQKEFPTRGEVYAMLLQLAGDADADRAKALAKEVLDSQAPDEVKADARGLLKKLDALGKPLALSFAAVDGRAVDLAKLKDKVVLVDFWATWCGPCVAELPKVKAVYDKLHPKGFEIVGISFDQDKGALEKFVKDQQMGWPQFFDGQGWQNKFGKEFGINSIPTMWLVDKKGVLRDMSAREDLTGKVEKLLAE